MTWIEEVKALAAARGLDVQTDGDRVLVRPSSDAGFEVWAHEAADEFTVGFDGWHDHFRSADSATELFEAGLSGECRLVVVKRGSAESSWTMGRLRDGAWIPESKTGLFLFPFWRRAVLAYRRNTPVDVESG
jgi:hypothetical protein